MKNVFETAAIEGLADILLQKFEARLVAKVGQIGESSGEKVIGDDDGVAFSQEDIA